MHQSRHALGIAHRCRYGRAWAFAVKVRRFFGLEEPSVNFAGGNIYQLNQAHIYKSCTVLRCLSCAFRMAPHRLAASAAAAANKPKQMSQRRIWHAAAPGSERGVHILMTVVTCSSCHPRTKRARLPQQAIRINKCALFVLPHCKFGNEIASKKPQPQMVT